MRKLCMLAALISPLACAQVVSVETNSLMRLPNTASTLQLERLDVADYGTLLIPANVTELTVGELRLGHEARIAIVPSEQALDMKVIRAELSEGSLITAPRNTGLWDPLGGRGKKDVIAELAGVGEGLSFCLNAGGDIAVGGREGGAADRKDIRFLGKLPVFNPDGSVK